MNPATAFPKVPATVVAAASALAGPRRAPASIWRRHPAAMHYAQPGVEVLHRIRALFISAAPSLLTAKTRSKAPDVSFASAMTSPIMTLWSRPTSSTRDHASACLFSSSVRSFTASAASPVPPCCLDRDDADCLLIRDAGKKLPDVGDLLEDVILVQVDLDGLAMQGVDAVWTSPMESMTSRFLAISSSMAAR